MRPLIGIPPCLDARGRWKPGRETHYLDARYVRALSEAGADAVLIPGPGDVASLVGRLDGLLVPGGDDFAPERPYPAGVRFDPVPQAQLDFDRLLLDAALARALPVLGICYGMQLLALHCGGRFHYDLQTDLPEASQHQLPEDAGHALRTLPGSRIARWLGDAPAPVNSRHHQAVADPGRGLRSSAFSPDGVVEAIELEGDAFGVGVQWHPEGLSPDHRRRIFGPFVEACRRG